LFWWLTAQTSYNSFDIACPNAVCLLMQNLAPQLAAGQTLDFSPIADDHEFTTDFQTSASLTPVSNVVSYNGATLDPTTIDLDPATDGQQTTFTASGGTFALQGDGSILFTPTDGYAGQTAAMYTIGDSNGRTSNPAQIRVTIDPAAGAALTLFGFETGTQGWQPGFWQSNIGSVMVSTDWASEGSQSLQVNATADGWFGVVLNPAQDWTGKTTLRYQVKTLSQGTSVAGVIKVGSAYLWCQGDFGFVPPSTVAKVEVDLTKMGCGVPDLSKVQEMYVWFSGGGTYYLDGVQIL
jgi:mannan endo-1,4-beta-mannosidase